MIYALLMQVIALTLNNAPVDKVSRQCEDVAVYYCGFNADFWVDPTEQTIENVASTIIKSNTCSYFGRRLEFFLELGKEEALYGIRGQKYNDQNVRAKIAIGSETYYIDKNGVIFYSKYVVAKPSQDTFLGIANLFYMFMHTYDEKAVEYDVKKKGLNTQSSDCVPPKRD